MHITEPTCQHLPDEAAAIAYFQKVGREEVKRQFDELCDGVQARVDELNAKRAPYDLSLITYAAIDYYTPEERALRHKLQLALMLCIDEQAEAKERITLRIAQRKKRRTPELASQQNGQRPSF